MLATLGTVVLPVALAELIEVLTGERSALLSVGLAIALSALIATAGSWAWQRRPGGRDILFGDLMLLGFVRRLRAERTLAETTRLLGVDPLSAEGVADRVQMLEQLARALDARDPFMVGHSLRVARNAEMVAARMGLPPEQVTKVRIAAAVHDAGKINTPTSILNKRGALTDEEFDIVKRHPGDGAQMLRFLGDPEIEAMVRHHHERRDGSGYPAGLTGESIPLGARIIAVADTFDAITSVRPYRPPRNQHAALRILKAEAGTRLDAQAVTAFLSCYAGRRTAAWSSLVVALPERLVGFLTGGVGPLGQGVAAAVALAGLGGAVVNPVVDSSPPPAKVGASLRQIPAKSSPGRPAAERAAAPPSGVPAPRRRGQRAAPAPPAGANRGNRHGTDQAPGSRRRAGRSPSTGSGTGAPETGSRGTDIPAQVLDTLRRQGVEAPALPALPGVPQPPALPGAPGL